MVLLKELVEKAKQRERENKKKQKKKRGKKYNKKKRKKPLTDKTKTGFSNLLKFENPNCKQGYLWRYTYNDICISKVDFLELRRIVLDMGLEWEITDRNSALKTSRLVGLPLYDLKNKY